MFSGRLLATNEILEAIMGNEMRILEYRQSNTSPLRYHIELTPEEMEALQSILRQVVEVRVSEEENGN